MDRRVGEMKGGRDEVDVRAGGMKAEGRGGEVLVVVKVSGSAGG